MIDVNGQIARITPRRMSGNKIQLLWATHSKRNANRDAKIALIRKLYAGLIKLKLPDDFVVEGAENLALGFPTKTTMPLRLGTILQQKVPRIKREAGGSSPAALARSTKIETFVNAVLDKLDEPPTNLWSDQIDLGLHEAEYAVAVTPNAAHWENLPDYLDVIEDGDYEKLSPGARKGYVPHGSKNGQKRSYARVDDDGAPLPKRVYQRDAQDRAVEDDDYEKLDDTRSAKAYRDDMRDFLARKLPFQVRVIPADDTAPIFGPGGRLEALLVKSRFTREQLIERDYVWDEDGPGGNALVIPVGGQEANSVDSVDLTLYEYWGYDRGKPYVAYSVEGLTTYKLNKDGDQKADAVIDLYEECGLTELPVAYVYGQHFRKSNPDNPGAPLGIPFAWPLIGLLLHRDMIATGVAVKVWTSGFTGWFYKPDVELLRELASLNLENPIKNEIKVRPLQAQPIFGDIIPATSPQLGSEVGAILQLIAGSLGEEGPNAAAFGGGDAGSARERAVIEDQVRGSMAQVLNGALSARKFIAEKILEISCYLGRTYQPVPVYANTKTDGTKRGTKQEIITLDPDIVGPVYDVTAYFPRVFGENLARSQMWIEGYKDGTVSFREMREQAYEDEAPEETLAEIIIDEYLRGEGVPEILEMAATQAGDEAMAERLRAIAAGDATQTGTPTAMAEGVPLPVAPAPGMAPTVDMGSSAGIVNPGMQSMAGTIGADMQSASVATTGDQQTQAMRGAPSGY